jgi:hypothetical protein
MHNVIARSYGIETCPLWLNEGFAQFYEFSEIQNNELLIGGVHEPAVDFILSFLLDDRWVDIENLLNANSDLFTVSTHSKSEYLESYTYYLFSWALVYYLTDRYDLTLPNAAPSPPPSGPIPPSDVPMMKRYLHDVKNGLSNTEAFENMIGTSIYLFESEWKKYFRNKIFKLMKT